MKRRPFEQRGTRRPPEDIEERGLSRRATRLLVVAGAVIVLILAYLSALILIEGARNPDRLPQGAAPEERTPIEKDAS